MAEIRLGTSGWSYDEWVGAFYPSDKVNKLTFYNRIFTTVEIDSTFYSYPKKGLVYGWAKYSQPGFIFSAKIPSLITHKKKLDLEQGVEEDLKRFTDILKPLILRKKLGLLLIQLPPQFSKDYERLEAFLNIVPHEIRFAVELRHLSWLEDETFRLLKKYDVAYTIVDEPLLPPTPITTTNFAVIRWHGRGRSPWYDYRYTLEELKPWVETVKDISRRVDEVFGYFNNHFHGYAVENCLQLLKMLGLITEEQMKVMERVEEYLNAKLRKPIEALIEKIPSESLIQGIGFDELLETLLPSQKLKRAKEIGDKEIEKLEVSEGLVKSKIRGYNIVIDVGKQIIMHDCADWTRCIPNKTLCKHLGKILLTIPQDQAMVIMRSILLEKERWQFKPYSNL
ncbi:MAG: DUF72 domain-containing protein [Nitrososphaerales archaeon]